MAEGAAARKLSSKRRVKSKPPRVPWTMGPKAVSAELDVLVDAIVILAAASINLATGANTDREGQSQIDAERTCHSYVAMDNALSKSRAIVVGP